MIDREVVISYFYDGQKITHRYMAKLPPNVDAAYLANKKKLPVPSPPERKPIKSRIIKDLPVKCPLCLKRFKRNGHLRMHLVSHNEENRIVECGECDRRFCQRGHLMLHMKSHGIKYMPKKMRAVKTGAEQQQTQSVSENRISLGKKKSKKGKEKALKENCDAEKLNNVASDLRVGMQDVILNSLDENKENIACRTSSSVWNGGVVSMYDVEPKISLKDRISDFTGINLSMSYLENLQRQWRYFPSTNENFFSQEVGQKETDINYNSTLNQWVGQVNQQDCGYHAGESLMELCGSTVSEELAKRKADHDLSLYSIEKFDRRNLNDNMVDILAAKPNLCEATTYFTESFRTLKSEEKLVEKNAEFDLWLQTAGVFDQQERGNTVDLSVIKTEICEGDEYIIEPYIEIKEEEFAQSKAKYDSWLYKATEFDQWNFKDNTFDLSTVKTEMCEMNEYFTKANDNMEIKKEELVQRNTEYDSWLYRVTDSDQRNFSNNTFDISMGKTEMCEGTEYLKKPNDNIEMKKEELVQRNTEYDSLLHRVTDSDQQNFSNNTSDISTSRTEMCEVTEYCTNVQCASTDCKKEELARIEAKNTDEDFDIYEDSKNFMDSYDNTEGNEEDQLYFIALNLSRYLSK